MKKQLLLFITTLLFGYTYSQTFNMCTNTLSTNTSGTIYDSGGPSGNYGNNEDCGFLIDPGCASSITLTFAFINIESCCDDINVYDGVDNSGPLLLNAQGTITPSPVTATSGTMYIEFLSDGSVTPAGFEASWSSVISGQDTVVAGFTVSNSNPDYQETISFTDTSTSNPNSWLWNFGDGTTSTLQNPTHTYYSSGSKTVTLIASNCTFSDTTTMTVNVNPPSFLLSPDTVKLDLDCQNGAGSTNYNFNNTAASPFGYEILSDLPLDTVLDRTNRFYEQLTSLVPSLYLFTNGDIGSSISDGGNDMYDTGNKLNTNISGASNIPYSDNIIVNSSNFGPNGKYFTVKNPGLFVMAADLDGVSNFNITGNLGADGNGNSDGTVLTTNAFGSTYRAFINRTYGTSDPSINRMIIVVDNPSASHTFLTTTDDEDHEVSNLASSQRIYYLLFAAHNGSAVYIDDNQMQIIFEEFVSWLETIPSFITISPMSDTIPANSSINVSFTFDPTVLAAGTYYNRYTIKNTTSPFATYYFYSEVNVTGVADYVFSDVCLDMGITPPGDALIDTLFYDNIGCDDLVISSLTSSNSDFTILEYDTTLVPGQTGQVLISFNPTSIATINGTLDFVTNVQDTSMCITGYGTNLTAVFENGEQDACTAEIEFTNNSIGQSDSWFWDFGDGNTSTLENPIHRFNSVGDFDVTFVSCNNLGCDTVVQTVTVDFILDYNIEITGFLDNHESLEFTVTGSDVLANTWYFGDGSAYPGIIVLHTYISAGTYYIQADLKTSEPCFITLYDSVVIGSTGIFSNNKGYEIYPNPNTGQFAIEANNLKGEYSISLVNSLGQEVLRKDNIFIKKQLIDVQLDDGVYMLTIYENGLPVSQYKLTIHN